MSVIERSRVLLFQLHKIHLKSGHIDILFNTDVDEPLIFSCVTENVAYLGTTFIEDYFYIKYCAILLKGKG